MAVGLAGGGVVGAALVADTVGDGVLLVVADAEGEVLVDGELVVGAGEDRRRLGVGLAGPVGEEVRDGDSRLVPR